MRLAVLHTRLSGYLAACLREYKRQTDAELLVYAWPGQPDAPFEAERFSDLGEIRNRNEASQSELEKRVREFQPDAILVSGWVDKGYVKVCVAMRKLGIPVIAGCDTQWKGSMRQHVAGWIAPWHVQKAIDVLWVSGERQRIFANALGYSGNHCWDGVYACDWESFDTTKRMTDDGWRMADDPFFLYVGRYVDVKGIDTLIEAYQRYCTTVDNRWKLVCAGAGPLRQSLMDAGAEDRGFVQPRDLPALMAEASAFVLPSRFEPWGVVVQEAAASGLPLICSDACGAAVHLLRDRFNGRCFPSGDAHRLAECLLWTHQQSTAEREEMGERSFELSKQYTPELWARTLVEGVKMLQD